MNSTGKIDVHNYAYRLEQQYDLIESRDKMLPKNKQLILSFVDYCKVNPKIREARIIKYFYSLRRMAELVKKPFKEMDEKDIVALLAKIQDMKSVKGKPFAQSSMDDFRKTISKFWRWLYFDEYAGEAPPMIRRMTVNSPAEHKEPETFSKEEVEQLLNGMNSPRDRAFFACLYDLGCRVGELLSMQIRHIQYTPEGEIQLLVESEKTRNGHWETLFESGAHFTTWLRLHPDTRNPDMPLWTMKKIDKQKRRYIMPLSYPSVRKQFHSVIKKQGIREGKKCTMHMLRKSKATHDLADGVPITYIESRGSWKKGSKALQNCYLSIQQKDKENAYKKKYNLPVNNGHKPEKELKQCRRCFATIDGCARYCGRCGMPIDAKAAADMKETKQEHLDMLSELVKQKVLEALAKKN